MKITMALHHYPPTYVGGVELITLHAARALAKRGHSMDIVCIENPWGQGDHVLDACTEEDGVRVHRLTANLRYDNRPWAWRYRPPTITDWFAEHLARSRPDVVHVQSAYLIGTGVIEAALEMGLPTVASLHDYWYVCPRTTLLRSDGRCCPTPADPKHCALCLRKERRRYRLADRLSVGLAGRLLQSRRVLRSDVLYLDQVRRTEYLLDLVGKPDAVVFQTRFLESVVRDAGARPKRTVLRRQGVEPWIVGAEKPAASGDGKLRIGYVGQVAEHKGVHVLIRAFRMLSHRLRRQANLTIYGDLERFPRYAAYLQRLIGNSADIRLGGSFAHDRIVDIHANLDVLVVPSVWYENSPTVILEAFACGTPVVASRLGGMAELVGADGGYLFRPGDAADLARVLGDVIADRSKLAELSQRLPRVDTVDDEVADLERLYAELTGLDLTLPTGHASPGSRVVRGVESA